MKSKIKKEDKKLMSYKIKKRAPKDPKVIRPRNDWRTRAKEADQRIVELYQGNRRLEDELKVTQDKLKLKSNIEASNFQAYGQLASSMSQLGEAMARLVMYATGQRFGGGLR